MRRAASCFFLWSFLALTGCFSLVHAQDPLVFKVATITPEGSNMTEALHRASGEMEEATGGLVKLRVYPGGVMGNDNVVLRKIRTGQLQGGTFIAGGLAKVYGDYQILGMPLLLKNYKQVDAARQKFEPVLTEGLEKNGFVSFGILESGFVYLMSDKPIDEPSDLKGQKVWVPEGDEISRAVFEEAGVDPIPLPIPDVLTGLQTNLVDTIAAPPAGAILLQWFTKVQYLTEVPLLYSYGTLAISKKDWNRIPEKQRSVVREILVRHMDEVDAETRKDNREAMETLKEEGVEFVPVSSSHVDELEKTAREALERFRGRDLFDFDLLGQVRKTVESVE